MISFPHPLTGHARSPLLLLPAEVRIKTWQHLFSDSKVTYDVCVRDPKLFPPESIRICQDGIHHKCWSIDRSQIIQTCGFAYLDTFAKLWSYTTMTYESCRPKPELGRFSESFAASATAGKRIPRIEIMDSFESAALMPCDLRAVRYFPALKELSISWVDILCQLPGAMASLNPMQVFGSDDALLQDSQHRLDRLVPWEVAGMLRCQDRTYRAFVLLRFYGWYGVDEIPDERVSRGDVSCWGTLLMERCRE